MDWEELQDALYDLAFNVLDDVNDPDRVKSNDAICDKIEGLLNKIKKG